MKLSIKITLGLTSVLAFSNYSLAEPWLGQMAKYMPDGGQVVADIKVLGYTEEIRSLADRVQQNVNQKTEWFNEYAMGLNPGEPIPYHQNLGVSKNEYETLLNGTDKLTIIEAGQTELSFKLQPDDTLLVTGLPGESPFNMFVYEAVSDSILSSYGTITKSEAGQGNLSNIPGSEWSGRLWSLNRSKDDNTVRVSFALGEMDHEKKYILLHEVNGVVEGQQVDYHYVLQWDKP